MLNSPLVSRPAWAWLWVVLLLLANHEDGDRLIWNGKTMELRGGQFITGRKKLAQLCGISESMVERVLKYLETEQQIEQQKTTKYRLITIQNWSKYQAKDNKSDNRRTTDEQQTDTFKNDKKIKKEYSPSGDKGKPKYNPLGIPILDAFKEVDAKNGTYYGNTTQRKACDFLIETYGLDKVLMAVKIIPKINEQKLYIQQITTPYELMNNWVKLGNAVRKSEKLKKDNILW